ncbi:hypothetical protein E2974_16010 [Paracoccus yeei]|uniref:hypothetical protein n=1 Tax=Paracoccus yeei TaxID=147645 RepID=UPI0037D0898F
MTNFIQRIEAAAGGPTAEKRDSFTFEMTAGDLAASLKGVSGSAVSRVTPIFSTALIEMRGNSVTFTTTDGVMSIVRTAEAIVADGSGRAAIPTETLEKVIARIPPAAVVVVDIKGGDMTLTCGEIGYSFAGMSAHDFPPISADRGATSFDVDAAELHRAIARVKGSMYAGDSRQAILGVCVRSAPGGLVGVGATDGSTAARTHIPGPGGIDLTVPPAAIDAIIRHLPKKGTVEMHVSEHQIGIESQNFCFSSLVGGTRFAPYEALIAPKDGSVIVRAAKADLVSALDRISVVSGESVGLVITTDGGRMTIETEIRALTAAASGSIGHEIVPCESTGRAVAGVTSSYLLRPLRATTSDEVEMHIHRDAIYLKTHDGDDIVMGRRVVFASREDI